MTLSFLARCIFFYVQWKRLLFDIGTNYLTFLIIIALSFRARSSDRSLRSKFFRAKTRFSEFLIWNLCSFFIILSIPLDVILRCINANADSKFPLKTRTRMPLHCWSCCSWWRPLFKGSVAQADFPNKLDKRLAIEFISRRDERIYDLVSENK